MTKQYKGLSVMGREDQDPVYKVAGWEGKLPEHQATYSN
jgi:hypothetical protein